MKGVGITLDLISITRMCDDLCYLRHSCAILTPAALVPGDVRHAKPHPELLGVSQVSALDAVKAVGRGQHQILCDQSPPTEGGPSLLRSQILMEEERIRLHIILLTSLSLNAKSHTC